MAKKNTPSRLSPVLSAKRPLVLVVEDHDDTRSLLKYLIEGHGCAVIEAEDGEQAVTLADRLGPDLILMDTTLPRMDGIAAARHIRQMATTNRVPIIFVSGHSQPEDRAAALAIGGNDYFVKPVNLSQLETAVERELAASMSQ